MVTQVDPRNFPEDAWWQKRIPKIAGKDFWESFSEEQRAKMQIQIMPES